MTTMQSNHPAHGLSDNLGAQVVLVTVGLIALVAIAWFTVF
jgi:hypothetical protein